MSTAHMDEVETKEEAFKRIAKPRVKKVIEAIRILGNTSDTARYEYTKANVEKTFDAIRDALGDVEGQFNRGIGLAEFDFDDDPPAEGPPLHVIDAEPAADLCGNG